MFSRLYLHIPWCVRKCAYCAFYSAAGNREQLAETVALLLREMELAADRYTAAPIDSIYFGGGTPSLLAPQQAQQLLDQARRIWPVRPDAEITLEANPGTVTATSLAGYRQAGITRLSLGVQSLHNPTLALLGRVHSAQDAHDALQAARNAGFEHIGIDLICGLPGQTGLQWRQVLQEAIAMQPDHLSVYSLSIEEGTPFADRYQADDSALPDNDLAAEMLEAADHLLTAAGFEHYEIANFARPGRRSRHNCGYWLRDGYLGLGPAAHSLILQGHGLRFSNPAAHSLILQGHGLRFSNPADYSLWAAEISRGRLAHQLPEPIEAAEALSEHLFLGLRMSDGVSAADCITRFGQPLWERHQPAITELIASGLLQEQQGGIALTQRGMLLANQVFMRFI